MNQEQALKLFEPFENILFDYGGIFIDIEHQRTVKAFNQLSGVTDFGTLFSKHDQVEIFSLLETGKITKEDFIPELKKLLALIHIDDQKIIQAWCAMLLEIPKERVDFLRELKKTKNIYMLSNINQIHEDYAKEYIAKHDYLKDFYSLFDHVYFSHHIGLRKPDPEVFEYVCYKSKLKKNGTIFLDDSIQHVEGARKAGLAAYHLDPGNTFIKAVPPK